MCNVHITHVEFEEHLPLSQGREERVLVYPTSEIVCCNPAMRCKFILNSSSRSITSHCTGPVSSSECPDLLNRSYSSRYGTPWYHSPHTSMTNGGCPSGHHQFHRQNRYGNGVYPNGTIGSSHGRLHKSLSFAFQSPHHMWGDYQQPHSCHQAHNVIDRCYSRYSGSISLISFLPTITSITLIFNF